MNLWLGMVHLPHSLSGLGVRVGEFLTAVGAPPKISNERGSISAMMRTPCVSVSRGWKVRAFSYAVTFASQFDYEAFAKTNIQLIWSSIRFIWHQCPNLQSFLNKVLQ
jgi:hypothetical protein